MNRYTLTLRQVLTTHKIFKDYPIFDEKYRTTFESNFINYFLFEEIAHETIELFIHRLNTRLNIIMPFYNKLFLSQQLEQRILDNYDVVESFEKLKSNDIKSTSNLKNDIDVSSTSRDLYKDAPKTRVDISDFDVVTNLNKNISNNNSNSTSSQFNDVKDNENEKWTRTMKGNIGIQTDADAIMKYESSLRNITLEIFEKELSQLFMGVF